MISRIKEQPKEVDFLKPHIDEYGNTLSREEVVLNELKSVLTKIGKLPKKTLNQKKKLKIAKDLNLGELIRVAVYSARAIDDFLHYHKDKQRIALEYERQLSRVVFLEQQKIINSLVIAGVNSNGF